MASFWHYSRVRQKGNKVSEIPKVPMGSRNGSSAYRAIEAIGTCKPSSANRSQGTFGTIDPIKQLSLFFLVELKVYSIN